MSTAAKQRWLDPRQPDGRPLREEPFEVVGVGDVVTVRVISIDLEPGHIELGIKEV